MSAKAKNKLTPQQRKATLNRVLHKIRPYSAFVVCSLLVAAVSVAAQLYIPILCGDAIDKMLGKGNVDLAGVLRIAVSILVVAAVAALAQWLLSVCNNRITFSVSRDLRNEALRKIQTLPLSYLDSHPSGDIVSRMVADVDTFADGLLMGFTQLFSGILTIFGTLLFMLRENVPITLVVVCITPLSLVVAGFLAKRSYGYFQSQSTVRGKQTALVNEMIEGQKVVQAFGHEAESLAAFDEVNGQLQDVSLKAIFFSSLTNPATRFVNNIVYAGVGLVGALYAVRGGITIGQLSVFLSYANQYTKPFNEISGVVTELQNALACAARVFELLDAEDQVPEAENAAALQPDGHVQLQDVSFRYLPDRPLIEGLSLDVQPGQRIAIVGPTGCGKTTLINLLMRFYDVNSGSIKVSGTDIRDVTRASLRGSYGMVLQDTWLRAGTVRENIAYGKPDATMDEVIAAAKAAHAHSFIRRLPEGYDTVIAEDGGNISQGQKQLLCIARVMLCLPPMLILDEATSSIDTRTEVRIQKAFARMMQGRTSFIVAHRLSTIREADVILVMKDGHIVEQGSHDQLLAQGGFYAKLYNSQFEGRPEDAVVSYPIRNNKQSKCILLIKTHQMVTRS
jgi:ATP-binding cassette subfamily B multidrug efflux pump